MEDPVEEAQVWDRVEDQVEVEDPVEDPVEEVQVEAQVVDQVGVEDQVEDEVEARETCQPGRDRV